LLPPIREPVSQLSDGPKIRGQVSGNDWASYFVTLAHILTSGITRNRSDFAKRNPLLELKNFTAFGLTTGEYSLEEMAREAKIARLPGDLARYIDLPVPPPEKGGIFDLPGDDIEDIAEWARKLAEAVERTMRLNCGVAFPRFIEYVVRNRKAVLARFAALAERFVNKLAPPDPWERRFALKFGYDYAGAVIAIEAGVLPCDERHARRSIAKLYRVARRCFSTDLDLADTALKNLQNSLTDERLPKARARHSQSGMRHWRTRLAVDRTDTMRTRQRSKIPRPVLAPCRRLTSLDETETR
jgi:hypothetical protein